jgi:UDP-N-acetylmuramoyl-tripeptide--D-alanyl-D-alanine ligase
MTAAGLFTLRQAQSWLPGARLWGEADTTISGVSSDSRMVRPGDLFIALRGERFDAHDFLSEAQKAGAAAALVSRRIGHDAQLEVADTRMALGQLAAGWRRRWDLPLVLVLGSNGKTTVKQMLAAIFLQAVGEANHLATAGNYNNDIGLPLTLMRLRSSHRLAVLELGMNHPGETAGLADIAKPSVVLINNAQREHQERMGSVSAVAQEHGAALHALPLNGVAVFPGDTEYTDMWRRLAAGRQVIDFAMQSRACVVGRRIGSAIDNSSLQIQTLHGDIQLQLPVLGEHNMRNALAACAAALAVGITLDVIKAGLEAFSPAAGRLQVLTRRPVTLIDDSYNANPDSVRAAIDVLADMPAPRTLILGDMGEVGAMGQDFHLEIGAYARSRGVDHLLGLGPLSRHACAAFGQTAQHFTHISALCEQLETQRPLQSGTVLVKGSRFMRMEQVLPWLDSPKERLCS